MSTGHYHRRWSANTAGRTTPTSQTLASTIEPSTYGTSWNSVRWNKPSTTGYRSHSAAIASRFEPKPYYSATQGTRTNASRFSNGTNEAAKAAAQVASLGPSVSARASRFDTSMRDGGNKYRNEAREILNKWTSRERNGGYYPVYFATRRLYSRYADTSFKPKPMENMAANGYLNRTNEYSYRKAPSVTPTRTTTSSVSRYSTDRNSFLSPSPTPQPHTPRAERPWRQRLAESSRIRASLGDDYRSRLGSTDSAASGSRARTSYTPSFATSYARPQVDSQPTQIMSRSYSPIRPRDEIYKSLTSTEKSPLLKARTPDVMSTSQESLRDEKKSHVGVSSVPKNPSIRESSLEREAERPKKKSSKERTARRNSRQRGYNQSSSSDDENDRSLTRTDTKRRRRRKKEMSTERGPLSPGSSAANGMPKSTDLSRTVKEDEQKKSIRTRPSTNSAGSAASACPSVAAIPQGQHGEKCRTSPHSSKTVSTAVTKGSVPTNDAKGVIVVEVTGPLKNDAKSRLPERTPSTTEASSTVTRTQKSATDASSILEDESQYSAVVHFKPNKPKKRVAPVPGLWTVAGADEFISKNKKFARDQEKESATYVWALRNRATVTKRTKATPRKATIRVPAAGKTVEDKKNEMKKESKKEMKENIPADGKDQKNGGTSMITKLFTARTRPAPEPAKEKSDEVKPEAKNVLGDKKKEAEKKEIAASPKDAKKVEPQKKAQTKTEPQKGKKSSVTGPTKKNEETTKAEKVVPMKTVAAKEQQTQMAAVIKSKSSRAEGISAVLMAPMWLSLKNTKRIREKKPVVTQSVNHSFSKTPTALAAKKTLPQKKKSSSSASLSCKASVVVNKTCEQKFTKKSVQSGAQVIVDKPIPDVNISHIHMRIKRPKRLVPIPEQQPVVEVKEPSVSKEVVRLRSADSEVKMSPLSQTRASEVLDDMRNSEPVHVVRRSSREEDYNSSGCLILPDQSLLEEYVKRKRGRLERLRSEPIRERDEPHCDSPANSTVSELLPACAVRVFERSPHGIPVITGPSRSVSRLSSVSVSSVNSNTPTRMLETLSSYNNFNSTPQGFLREHNNRIQIAKPIQFDPPKTPFEERLQQQANAIRRSSAASSTNAQDLDRLSSPRRISHPADGMTSLSTSYTAAIAANSNSGRHERYAAHIPVNKSDSSGRQSTVSQDSQHSGALDSATKQMDQVIDQARQKHNQHRNKFKEAIDYLDQIFEDLKKEVDTGVEDKSKDRSITTVAPQHSTVISPPDNIRRPTVIHPNTSKPSTSAPNRNLRQVKPAQPPSPVEIVLPPPSAPTDRDSAEFDVTETIVLPKKTDKLDFTRRWLQDDLMSLAHQPPAPIMILPEPCSYYNDADEHSLGSCSAEVAAINLAGKKEKPKRSNGSTKNNSLEKPAPIRPQPCRPQPVYAAQGKTGGPRHFPVELEVPNIPRVSSFDHVPDRKEHANTNTWRSGSQEPFQAHGSVKSEDALRPSPSAFQSVSSFSNRANMRGSLRSLPDAGLIIRGKYHQVTPPKDPTLAIDQLCAELELNTDQPMTAQDKRRSFPTSFVHEKSFASGSTAYEQPIRRLNEKTQPYQQPKPLYHTAVSTQQPVHQTHSTVIGNNRLLQAQHQPPQQAVQHPPSQQRTTAQPPPAYTTHPVVRKAPQRQQKSLDEVTNMLNNVVNEFHTTQQQRKKPAPQHSHALYATPHSTNQSNPFETINQEKISPSRVEAMHNMFERNAEQL